MHSCGFKGGHVYIHKHNIFTVAKEGTRHTGSFDTTQAIIIIQLCDTESIKYLYSVITSVTNIDIAIFVNCYPKRIVKLSNIMTSLAK